MRSPSHVSAALLLAALVACAGAGDENAPAGGADGAEGTADTGGTGDSGDTGDTGDTGESPDPPVDADGDGFVAADDCDDADAAVHPGAMERCDGVDNNCDGAVDEGLLIPVYADVDGDGFGDEDTLSEACADSVGYALEGGDCDDTDPAVHPGALEICDGVDTDCDGAIGEVRVPSDYLTLGDALDAGEPRICLEAGAHSGGVWRTLTRDTVIEGVSSAESTLDAGGLDRTLDLELYGYELEVRDLTISGGVSPDSDAGGLYAFGWGSDGAVTVSGVVFTNNSCADDTCWGAGLSINGVASVVLVDVESHGNTIEGGACGAVSLVGVGVLEIDGLDVHDEDLTAVDDALAGGLLLLYVDEASLNDVRVADIDVVATEEFFGSVGVYVDTDLDVANLEISGNSVEAASCYTPGLFADMIPVGTYRNVDVRGNACTTSGVAYAGGLLHSGTAGLVAAVDVTNLVVAGNILDAGEVWAGAVMDRWSTATYTNITVTGNATVADAAADPAGAGVLFAGLGADATFVNADVSDNSIRVSSGSATTFASTDGGGGYTWSHSNLRDATFSTTLTDPTGVDGNISVDPSYVDVSGADPMGWDLTLATSSPLRDAGDAGIIDPDGTTSDIGAYGGPGAADW